MDIEPHISVRRRYSISIAKVAAGSALTAASVASLTGLTTAGLTTPAHVDSVGTYQPEPDASTTLDAVAVAGSGTSLISQNAVTSAAADPVVVDSVDSAAARSDATATATSATARLEGVRAELQDAVVMGLVTEGQAQGFLAQIEHRIARGL